MHLHILGVCGTFMGGIAAIARAAGHRVTGSDRNVYPPMSTQLAALGIDVIEGLRPGPAQAESRRVRRRQRHEPRQCARRSAARQRPAVTNPAPNGSRATCCSRDDRWVLGGRRHARQDDDEQPARVDSRARGPCARLPDRRRAARFRRERAARRRPALRHRGRRVRHRVLRQARQVRPLPAAHRDPQQPRARPRRHLSGRGLDPEAVSPAAAHGARQRPADRQCRGTELRRSAASSAAGRPSSVSGSATIPAALDWRIAPAGGAGDYSSLRGLARRACRRVAWTGTSSASTTRPTRWPRWQRRRMPAWTRRRDSRRCAGSVA